MARMDRQLGFDANVLLYSFVETATAYLRLLLGVHALHARVIDSLSGLTHLQVDHWRTIAAVALRQIHDLLSQLDVAVRSGHATQCRGTHAALHHVLHHFPARRRGHHFFRRTSFVTSSLHPLNASTRFYYASVFPQGDRCNDMRLSEDVACHRLGYFTPLAGVVALGL